MKRYTLLVTAAFYFSACSTPAAHSPARIDSTLSTGRVPPKEKEADNALTDTLKVKTWLSKVITDYTNGNDPRDNFEQLRKNFTEDYYHYKQGSIDLEYDNADGDTTLTEEGWKKKWHDKFDTKYVGNGGYIISAQDNGKCAVTLHLIKHIDRQTSLYKVAIKDIQFNITYNRDIKVINQDLKWLIADIIEYN